MDVVSMTTIHTRSHYCTVDCVWVVHIDVHHDVTIAVRQFVGRIHISASWPWRWGGGGRGRRQGVGWGVGMQHVCRVAVFVKACSVDKLGHHQRNQSSMRTRLSGYRAVGVCEVKSEQSDRSNRRIDPSTAVYTPVVSVL